MRRGAGRTPASILHGRITSGITRSAAFHPRFVAPVSLDSIDQSPCNRPDLLGQESHRARLRLRQTSHVVSKPSLPGEGRTAEGRPGGVAAHGLLSSPTGAGLIAGGTAPLSPSPRLRREERATAIGDKSGLREKVGRRICRYPPGPLNAGSLPPPEVSRAQSLPARLRSAPTTHCTGKNLTQILRRVR